jgi:hypothetical protein
MSLPADRDRLASVALAVCAGVTAIAGVATGVAVPAGAVGSPTVNAAAFGAAEATAGPRYLTASQLPQGSRYGTWETGRAHKGLPYPRTFCLGGTMSASTTSYTTFESSTEAGAQQYVSTRATEAGAVYLVGKLRSAIEACHKAWIKLTSNGIYKGKKIKAGWQRYGTFDVADGMTVWGVFTTPPKPTPPTTHMYAVGREGRTVTVLHIGLNGTAGTAPVEPFTDVAETAVRQLY